MSKLLGFILALCSATLLAGSACAANYYSIGPVLIADVSVIQVPLVGHQVGTLEIKLAGGFSIPAGLTCTDRFYLATLKQGDPELRMLALLITAQVKKTPVNLIISDDPASTAYAGRCSFGAVTLTQ